MPFSEHSYDAIFCRGVIFITNLECTLREFYRVLKPGGKVYIDCNADAWNEHLMNERGKDNPDAFRQGRDTLYNTTWRRHSSEAIKILRESVEKVGLKVSRGETRMDVLLDEMDRHLRNMCPSKAETVRALEIQSRVLCGEPHLPVILSDMFANAAGRQSGPSVSVTSEAWQPEEVEKLIRLIGFRKFSWWSEAGTQESAGKRPLEVGPQLDGPSSARRHYRGHLTVWHALFDKPL